MKQLISPTEFAKVIKRDAKTVRRWIEKGWIPSAKRVGHRYQIPAKEIEVYKNSAEYPALKWQK